MDSLALDIQEGAFYMNTQHSGHLRDQRSLRGRDRCSDHIQIGADQGGEESGRAELAMRCPDGPDRLDTGRIVEEYTAAAIDLQVDETGEQQLPGEVVLLSCGAARIVCCDDGKDPVAFYQYAAIIDQSAINQYPPIDQGCCARGGHSNGLSDLAQVRWAVRIVPAGDLELIHESIKRLSNQHRLDRRVCIFRG